MTEIQFRSDFTVQLLDHMGNDARICQAARVSTEGAASLESDEASGLINYLMKHRHGSPFESGVVQFYVEAPIFVFREMMRHRIASYNETSARYRDLEPVFYSPPGWRGVVRTTTAARPEFELGSLEQRRVTEGVHKYACTDAWRWYQVMRANGVASEVARNVLPVGIYSSAYVTMNLRALMNFLSLRTHDKGASFVSYPQWEIEQVANDMEFHFERLWPLTWTAFNDNGRTAP